MGLNYDEITAILKIIDGSSCDELIVETGDIKLVVRRKGADKTHAASEASPAAPSIAAPSVAAPSVAAPSPIAPPRSAAPAANTPHQIEVVAPMVGTFYSAPSPGAPPFVEEGSVVRRGDSLCLIEVMKLFTTITSEHAGRIVQIGAQNGEFVEYGHTLFVIEPA